MHYHIGPVIQFHNPNPFWYWLWFVPFGGGFKKKKKKESPLCSAKSGLLYSYDGHSGI